MSVNKISVWISTYKDECLKAHVPYQNKVLACVETSKDAEVAIVVSGRKDGPPMEDAGAICVATAMQSYPLIRSLTLTHQAFGDGAAAAFQSLLSIDTTLLSLDLRYNNIGPAGCATICSALHANTSLRILDLSGNPLGPDGGFNVAEMLQENTALASLTMDDTDIDTEAVVAIATAMHFNTTLTALSLANPRLFSLSDETSVHFAAMLKTNSTIVSLDLSKHNMHEHGLRQIVTALLAERTEPPGLRSLNLRCNKLGHSSGALLASLIAQSQSLEMLNVSCCGLGDDGAIPIAEVLAERITLTSLDATQNSISSNGLLTFARSILRGSQLHSLKLWGNTFDSRAAMAFADALKSSSVETDFLVDQPEVGKYRVAMAS